MGAMAILQRMEQCLGRLTPSNDVLSRAWPTHIKRAERQAPPRFLLAPADLKIDEEYHLASGLIVLSAPVKRKADREYSRELVHGGQTPQSAHQTSQAGAKCQAPGSLRRSQRQCSRIRGVECIARLVTSDDLACLCLL